MKKKEDDLGGTRWDEGILACEGLRERRTWRIGEIGVACGKRNGGRVWDEWNNFNDNWWTALNSLETDGIEGLTEWALLFLLCKKIALRPGALVVQTSRTFFRPC
jgi:hypothetical protein